MAAVRYSDELRMRCQPELTLLVEQGARVRGTKPSEYARQRLIAGLRADGFDLALSYPAEPNANLEPSLSQGEAS